jgi:serine/threonine-protein kinase
VRIWNRREQPFRSFPTEGSDFGTAESDLSTGILDHCDLKPTNILMEGPDLVHASLKIADLGFVKSVSGEGGQKAMPPSDGAGGREAPREGCQYLAPEQWINMRPVDGAADVYALGVLLFQMLAGRVPFLSVDPQALMYQHMFEPPPLMQIPIVARAKVADLLDAMLAKRPDKRPRIEDVREHLNHVRIL